jgi:hypothetical protein
MRPAVECAICLELPLTEDPIWEPPCGCGAETCERGIHCVQTPHPKPGPLSPEQLALAEKLTQAAYAVALRFSFRDARASDIHRTMEEAIRKTLEYA